MKICSRCKEEKNISEFYKDESRKDGLYPICKLCHLQSTKKWKDNNQNFVLEQHRIYNGANKLLINSNNKNYKELHKKERNIQRKEKYNSDISYKITQNLRSRLHHAINGNSKSGHTLELLGCTIEEFKQYLENQFTPEMSWDNYGTYWEIDHILPCASFDLSDPEQQKICFHYTNLQPLGKLENRTKNDFLPDGTRARNQS